MLMKIIVTSLAKYFVDNYNRGLQSPPSFFDVNITKLEVWVTNVGITATVGARNE